MRTRKAAFAHTLKRSKDYINEPKIDGYRGVHLIYRYSNPYARDYEGLYLELQLRTKLQHAWATAVETMGTFLGQSLKSGQGENQWRDFFTKASAALSVIEKTMPVPGFENITRDALFSDLAASEKILRVFEKLESFAIATDRITTERGKGAYYLIVLDSKNRSVMIRPYLKTDLDRADIDYAEFEKRTKAGEPIEAVLVAVDRVKLLQQAYPNYFFDTRQFVTQMCTIIGEASKGYYD